MQKIFGGYYLLPYICIVINNQLNLIIMKTVTITAYCQDYSEKAFKLMFGLSNFEFIPKKMCEIVEFHSEEEEEEFKKGKVASCYIELPVWLFKKLKGTDFYGLI